MEENENRRGVLGWIGRHELATLLLVLGAAAGVWAFAAIVDLVVAGETDGFDERLLLAMRSPGDPADPIGPAWVEELGRDFTALGGVGILGFIALAVAGFLLLCRRGREAGLVVAAILGGMLLSTFLKSVFGRPRPDLVPHGTVVSSASFPSGHSMMSAVTYLTLGALLARFQARKRRKAYLLCLAVTVTLLVGVSRIYLGVHWPTDVLAGWAGGAVWAILCWLVARWLQQRGRIEPETDE